VSYLKTIPIMKYSNTIVCITFTFLMLISPGESSEEEDDSVNAAQIRAHDAEIIQSEKINLILLFLFNSVPMVANIYYIAVKMGILLSDETISKVTPGYFSSDTMKEMMYVACFWSACRFTALRWRLSSAAFDRMHSRFVEIIRHTVIMFFMLKTFFTFSTSNILLIQQFFVCQLVHLMFYFKL